MTSKECEEQLESLVEAWQLNEADLNQTDIEAIKHLMLENQMQHKEISKLKQPTIFIDTQDMEERYGEGLYMDYLKEENQQLKEKMNCDLKWALKYDELFFENKQLKDRINRAIEYIDYYVRIDDEHYDVLKEILKEDNKEVE